MTSDKKTKTTEADKIWDTIKDRTISVFSLPSQKISEHVINLNVPGEVLLVKLSSSAVLPVLEQVICDKYVIAPSDKGTYYVIQNKPAEVNLEAEQEELRKKIIEAAVNPKSTDI